MAVEVKSVVTDAGRESFLQLVRYVCIAESSPWSCICPVLHFLTQQSSP